MGWSNGTFSRVHDWTADEASAIDIQSTRMDQEDDNFATGIDTCLTKDGSNEPTADLPMGGNRHTGVGNANALDGYASAADVIDQHLTYYVDSGAADAYVITPSPAITAYAEGQRFVFRATNANTGASTLNVNGLGAIAIETPDATALVANMILVGGYYEVIYDANDTPDRWVLMSPSSTAVQGTRTITAGAGLTGGGDLSANRTVDVGAGTGITVNANDVALDTGNTRNVAHTSVTLTAGGGLTGGGDISANRSFAVGAGTGITVNADDVALAATVAGNGLAHSSGVLSVGAGTGITVNANDVAVDLNELGTETTIATGDFIAMVDITDNGSQKITLNNFASSINGSLTLASLSDYDANDHIDHTVVAILAGTGMTGGGTINQTRTLNINGGAGITANASDIALTDAASTASNPIDVSSGAITIDVAGLTTIEGNALAATDTFLVDDGGTPKGIEVQDAGFRVQSAQTTQSLGAADMNSIMEFNGTATLTIPEYTTTALPNGAAVIIVVDHATQNVTVTAAASVTLNSIFHPGGGVAASDTVVAGGTAVLIKTATNEWYLSGDIGD